MNDAISLDGMPTWVEDGDEIFPEDRISVENANIFGEMVGYKPARRRRPTGRTNKDYPLGWTEDLKVQMRARDGFQCQSCGKHQGSRALDIHHIDGSKANCATQNLVSLCSHCHRGEHHDTL